MMKKLYFMCLLAFLGCGGGSDDLTPSGDTTSFDTSNFAGTYDYQDDNCSYPLITQFTVTQSDNNLTLVITKPGLSGYSSGDSFSGSRVYASGLYVADFYSELGCQAIYVSDDEEADYYTTNYGVTFLAEDLLVACDDAEAEDEICVIAYEKQ